MTWQLAAVLMLLASYMEVANDLANGCSADAS
jgi:hypothetical protein